MAIHGKPTSLDAKTGLPFTTDVHDGVTRCLAVLCAASTALTDLDAAITIPGKPVEIIILDLLLSLNEICDGDGVQLRADTEAVAKRLGCTIIPVDLTKQSNMH